MWNLQASTSDIRILWRRYEWLQFFNSSVPNSNEYPRRLRPTYFLMLLPMPSQRLFLFYTETFSNTNAAEFDLPVNYQERQCLEFMKLGLQGVTIVFASGDSGVAARAFDPEPNGCLGTNNTIFNPDWPGGCPYILTVGATTVFSGSTVFEPEAAVFNPINMPFSEVFFSGGGFSNIYPIPEWQTEAVAKFFASPDGPTYPFYEVLLSKKNATLGANGGIYNRIGRGQPDVAANGDNTLVSVGGSFGISGGTSASKLLPRRIFIESSTNTYQVLQHLLPSLHESTKSVST